MVRPKAVVEARVEPVVVMPAVAHVAGPVVPMVGPDRAERGAVRQICAGNRSVERGLHAAADAIGLPGIEIQRASSAREITAREITARETGQAVARVPPASPPRFVPGCRPESDRNLPTSLADVLADPGRFVPLARWPVARDRMLPRPVPDAPPMPARLAASPSALPSREPACDCPMPPRFAAASRALPSRVPSCPWPMPARFAPLRAFPSREPSCPWPVPAPRLDPADPFRIRLPAETLGAMFGRSVVVPGRERLMPGDREPDDPRLIPGERDIAEPMLFPDERGIEEPRFMPLPPRSPPAELLRRPLRPDELRGSTFTVRLPRMVAMSKAVKQ